MLEKSMSRGAPRHQNAKIIKNHLKNRENRMFMSRGAPRHAKNHETPPQKRAAGRPDSGDRESI